jgi:DNA-binding CsgD family transcriptional regulator
MTPREQQILALLLQGLGTQEMAETLGLAANTIKAFIRLVMVKMGVRSRAAIVTKILRLVLFGDSSSSSAVPAVSRVGDVGTKQKG